MTQRLTDTILLCDHDPAWQTLFAEEKVLMLEVIGQWAETIEHVGSTAVPGLAAKPIIDIGVGLRSLADGIRCISPLVALGYECLGEYGIPGRIYFRKRTDSPLPGQSYGGVARTHQVHMYETAHPEWEAHLLFRDYLRAHPEAAREYEALKRGLAARHGANVEAYADAKTEFIHGVLAEARRNGGGHSG